MEGRMASLRLRLASWLCPETHRIFECDPNEIVTDARTIVADLMNGADALNRGWRCHPMILVNAAEHIRKARP